MIIYGHNINGRRYFGYLQNFREETFFKEHPKFSFTAVGEKEKEYCVVSVLETDKYAEYYSFTDYGNEEDYCRMVEKILTHIGVRIFASQKLGGLKMHKELEVMKPRCKGLWKKCSALIAGMYFRVLSITPLIAKAADKKSDTTDTGVSDVTDGIDVIKDLVLGCVGGVGVIFLAWGLLDFGTAYAAHETTQQSQAIKKVIGGLIMIAVPAILKLLGVS